MTRRASVVCRVLSLATLFAVAVAAPRAARAQGATHSTAEYTEQQNDGGQAIVFTDDPMRAGGIGALVDVFKGRRPPSRSLLLRPRYQFVTEMLKSVENL
jgi:hypothetical protein